MDFQLLLDTGIEDYGFPEIGYQIEIGIRWRRCVATKLMPILNVVG
jgi:hypothetical protein